MEPTTNQLIYLSYLGACGLLIALQWQCCDGKVRRTKDFLLGALPLSLIITGIYWFLLATVLRHA